MIRVRRCTVRALVHDPLLAADREALGEAVRRLVADIVISRLRDELERVGAVPVLPAVNVRVVLPDVVVLALAGPAAASGDSLGSFGADLAVQQAVSRAVYDAHTRVTLETSTSAADATARADKPGESPAMPDQTGTAGTDHPAQTASPGPRRAADYTPDFAAATARALVRAFRLGRHATTLALAGPAGTAAWIDLITSEAGVKPVPETALRAPAPGSSGLPPRTEGEHIPPRVPPLRSSPTAADYAVASVLAELGATADGGTLTLAAAIAAAGRLGLSPLDATIWEAVTRRAGATPSLGRSSGARQSMMDLAGQPPAPLTGEVPVVTVLPFLLLGPLGRLGLLDSIVSALVAAGLDDHLSAFGAALARKVLPPPARGWLNETDVTRTVGAAVGHRQPPDGVVTERLTDRAPDWWPIVHAAVVAEMVAGRTAQSCLLVAASEHGLAVADGDGVFPLLWDAPADQLASLWAEFERPPVLVDPGLDDAIRIEGTQTDPAAVANLAELAEALSERPASGRIGLASGLDGPLAVLAGTGLAVLAWDLWHGREPTHPALALNRFADLDGSVTFAADRITVHMPLGRRHADLRDAGLLETVRDVPWLPGRRLEFTGG